MYSPEEIKKAKKRVKAKKDFYQHLMAFVIINGFLMFLNLFTSPSYFWFLFPLLGWGIGLAFHYVDVFGVPGFGILSQEWEERELQDELRKNEKIERKPVRSESTKKNSEESLELKELSRKYDDSELV